MMIGITKIGEIYTYRTEKEMLEVANKLEQQGYAVKRRRLGVRFTVEIIGYR